MRRGSEGRRESFAYRLVIYVILVGGALPVLLPFYWMLIASLKTKERVEAYPPDWLPVVPKASVTIAGQSLPVKVFDDGMASGTRVRRLKVLHDRGDEELLLELPAGEVAATTSDRYVAMIDGRTRRVEPLADPTAGEATVELALVGTRRQAEVPAKALERVTERTVYWSVLGREVPVKLDVEHLPTEGSARIMTLLAAPIAEVAPEIVEATGQTRVRYRERLIPARLIGGSKPAGFLTIELLCPDDGLRVPVGELREAFKTRFYLSPQRIEVAKLGAGETPGMVRVEVLGEARTARVPAAALARESHVEYHAQLLGQPVQIEPVSQPLPADPRAAVAVRVSGTLAVTADRIVEQRPLRPQWINFVKAWREQRFDLYLANTLLIASLVVLGTVLSCGLVGYAFARLNFRGSNVLFLILLSTMMIPGQVTSIPTFVMYATFGWIDTYLPLTLPAFLSSAAFFVFLYRQFMMTIPVDLEDSARIDGCGPLATWWLIMMPLCKPIIVTVAVFSFIGAWNDFLGPLLYINSDHKQTIALGLQNFKSTFQTDDPQLLMAASVMMLIPTVVLFFLAQKAFIRGVVISGVKG